MNGHTDVRGNEPIFAEDKVVGLTTSGGYGHFTGKSLGFGYVPPALSAPGTVLQVRLLGELHDIELLADPVHDPANERLRA